MAPSRCSTGSTSPTSPRAERSTPRSRFLSPEGRVCSHGVHEHGIPVCVPPGRGPGRTTSSPPRCALYRCWSSAACSTGWASRCARRTDHGLVAAELRLGSGCCSGRGCVIHACCSLSGSRSTWSLWQPSSTSGSSCGPSDWTMSPPGRPCRSRSASPSTPSWRSADPIDIHRRRNTGAPSLLMFGAYLTMFPQLVAGPIVRAQDLLPQLENPPALDLVKATHGLFDRTRSVQEDRARRHARAVDRRSRVRGARAVQLARGDRGRRGVRAPDLTSTSRRTPISRSGSRPCSAFTMPENFRTPYRRARPASSGGAGTSRSARWLRDYLYITLGGSRVRPLRDLRNLILTSALTGLWHGAAWTFVVWGLYYGVSSVSNGPVGRALRAAPRAVNTFTASGRGRRLGDLPRLAGAGRRVLPGDGRLGGQAWDASATFAGAGLDPRRARRPAVRRHRPSGHGRRPARAGTTARCGSTRRGERSRHPSCRAGAGTPAGIDCRERSGGPGR